MDQFAKNSSAAGIQLPIADKTVTTELSGDFTLPDYQPEIKRLLWVGACVLPPSKYVGDRQAEFAGSVDYYVLYIGSDNAPYMAPLTAEYKVDMPFESDADELRAFSASASIVPDMISGRVTAPRKISIKCRLKSRVQAFGELLLEDGFVHGENGLQVLRGEIQVYRTLKGVGELLRISDEMLCDNRDGDVRVISAEGRVLMSEITASPNTINCRGDLYIKLLLCREDDGNPYSVTRKMPLSQSILVEGAMQGDGATAKASICELNVTVDEGRIEIETGIIVEVTVAHIENAEFVKDVYSVSRKSDNGYRTIAIPSNAACFGGNFTLSDSLTLDEASIPLGAKIIDAFGNAFIDEYCFENGKCALGGKAKISMLLEKDGEFSVSETELPFNYKTGAEGNFSRAVAEAQVVHVRARTDGDRVAIDAEVGFTGMACTYREEKILSDAVFGEELIGSRGEIVVCYPSNDDTLWSVGKRYGAALDSIRENNKLSETVPEDSPNSLENSAYLIV